MGSGCHRSHSHTGEPSAPDPGRGALHPTVPQGHLASVTVVWAWEGSGPCENWPECPHAGSGQAGERCGRHSRWALLTGVRDTQDGPACCGHLSSRCVVRGSQTRRREPAPHVSLRSGVRRGGWPGGAPKSGSLGGGTEFALGPQGVHVPPGGPHPPAGGREPRARQDPHPWNPRCLRGPSAASGPRLTAASWGLSYLRKTPPRVPGRHLNNRGGVSGAPPTW